MLLRGKSAVLFDAGFTLLEPTVGVADVYLQEAAALGIALPAEEFRRRLRETWSMRTTESRPNPGELTTSEELEREAWRRFTWQLCQPFAELVSLHGPWLERLFTRFDQPAAWQPMDGAAQVLAGLRERGFTVGIVSNWHGVLHQILEGHDLKRHCHFVVTSAEAGYRKPHPAIFEQALQLAGAAAQSTVFIGDSWDDDIEGALAAGLAPILFASGPAQEFERPGNRSVAIIHSLTALLDDMSDTSS